MHSHQFEWLFPPEGLFLHSETTARVLSQPVLQFIWAPYAEEQLCSFRTCGCGRNWLQDAHYLLLSSGLDSFQVPQRQHITPVELKQKAPPGSQAANYCVTQLLGICQYSVVCYMQHCHVLATGSVVFIWRQRSPLYHTLCSKCNSFWVPQKKQISCVVCVYNKIM